MQRAGSGTLPPPGFTMPPWEVLAEQWNSIPLPSSPVVLVGPATLVLGHHDSEAEDGLPGVAENVKDHTFGWDNESPARTVQVGAFKAEWRPVTNKEFETFRNKQAKGVVDFPKSWVDEDGEIKVCFLFRNTTLIWLTHCLRFEQCMGLCPWLLRRIGPCLPHMTTSSHTQVPKAVDCRPSLS